MSTYTFMRVKWRTDPFQTEIWYGDPRSQNYQQDILKVGEEFNIKILPGKFCIGSESHKGGWITCKKRQINDNLNPQSALQFIQDKSEALDNTIDVTVIPDNRTYIQCYRCSTTEYFTCRMTCQGDICNPTSASAEKLCQPPNTSVYLTYVGGEFKIGVSLGIPRRWVEQASDLATVVAIAPGLEARRLELVASQELDLKLQVRNTTKLQNLTQNNLEGARAQLKKTITEIQPLAERILKDVPSKIIEKPKIRDLTPVYGNLNIDIPIQEVDTEVGNEFGGTIEAIKGTIMIVSQGDYFYAMDLKKLRSRRFKFLDRPAKIETQSYLDQWF